MAFMIDNYLITQVVDLEDYSRETGALNFRLEELQDFTLSGNQEKSEITGRNGRTIGYKKSGKTVSGEGTSGVISTGLMKAQTGGEVTYGTFKIKKSEVKIVEDGKFTTDGTAIGTAGEEIGFIQVIGENNAVIASYEQATTADDTHFAYDPTTKTVTVPTTGVANGTKILFAYERNVDGTKVNNPSDKYSSTDEVWVHAFGQDTCTDKEFFIAIQIPRADFGGEFSLEFGGDQVVQNFQFDSLPDICNTTTGSDLYNIIVYDKEVA